jgi:hypothetical protein
MDTPGRVVGALPVRPDLLAYPSPTTARYVIFATALLASGLYVGDVLHQWVWGEEWSRTWSACRARYGGGQGLEAFTRNEQVSRCMAGVDANRASVMLAGAALIAVVAVGLLLLAPRVVVRRRGLRPLPGPLAGARRRFDELAAEAGVGGRVLPLLGRSAQRDAFTFGSPRRYRVALPPAAAVRFRDAATFDPLVSHELAHVLNRDVALAWLTRVVWVALAPALLLPLLIAPMTGNADSLAAYGWRTGLLAVVVALLSADLLREREHGADLRAARLRGAADPVVGLVRRVRDPDPTLRNRVLANHPTSAERVAVLEDPAVLARVGFRDGLTGGFLAGLAVPLVVSALMPMLGAMGRADWSYLLASALLGPMLAGAVGLGLGRAALVSRVRGLDAAVWSVAPGVGLGLALGQAVSLKSTTLGTLGTASRPGWLLVTVVAGAGAALVVSGVSHLVADAAPRLRSVRLAWGLTLVVAAAVFSTVLWSTTVFQQSVDAGGWALGRQAVPTLLSPWWLAGLAVLLAALTAGLVLARPRAPVHAPAWAVEGPSPPWPVRAVSALREPLAWGAMAGLGGVAVMVGFRAMAGPGGQEMVDRFLAYQWVAGLAAASTLLPALLRRPARGAGLALLAAPVAALVVTGGHLVLNEVLGDGTDAALVGLLARPALGVGFQASLLLAVPAALVAGWLPREPGLRQLPTLLLAMAVAAGLSATVLAARDGLVGGDADAGARGVVGDRSTTERLDPVGALVVYEREVAPDIERRYGDASLAAQRIWRDAGTPATARAELTHALVVEPLEATGADWEGFSSSSTRVSEIHAVVLTALRTSAARYRILVDSGGSPDAQALARFAELGQREADLWNRWRSLRVALAQNLLSGS